MTGEKIRSLRRDHKPSKEDGELLAPGDDEATAALGGAFTGARTAGGKGGKACARLFGHHHRLPPRAAPGAPAPPPAGPAACPATDGGRGPALYPVHECVFKGDVRRLSSLIRTHNIGQKDSHGNTPLHLAVMSGNKECAHLLLAHNAPVKVKNAQGWSPLAEAISYGDRQMITALLRKLKQQSRESVEEKRPRLLKALKELGDFYLELHWDFQSWGWKIIFVAKKVLKNWAWCLTPAVPALQRPKNCCKFKISFDYTLNVRPTFVTVLRFETLLKCWGLEQWLRS